MAGIRASGIANDYDVTEAMVVYGGGFVRKLAEAFRAADEDNRLRLKTAFPEYWAQYTEMAEAVITNESTKLVR